MEKVKQLSKAQAIKFAQSGVWEDMSCDQIVKLQLFQSRLCVPFDEFHRAISVVLNRDVYTHEFANPDALKSEFLGEKEPPTFEEILQMIPEEKRVIIVSADENYETEDN